MLDIIRELKSPRSCRQAIQKLSTISRTKPEAITILLACLSSNTDDVLESLEYIVEFACPKSLYSIAKRVLDFASSNLPHMKRCITLICRIACLVSIPDVLEATLNISFARPVTDNILDFGETLVYRREYTDVILALMSGVLNSKVPNLEAKIYATRILGHLNMPGLVHPCISIMFKSQPELQFEAAMSLAANLRLEPRIIVNAFVRACDLPAYPVRQVAVECLIDSLKLGGKIRYRVCEHLASLLKREEFVTEILSAFHTYQPLHCAPAILDLLETGPELEIPIECAKQLDIDTSDAGEKDQVIVLEPTYAAHARRVLESFCSN